MPQGGAAKGCEEAVMQKRNKRKTEIAKRSSLGFFVEAASAGWQTQGTAKVRNVS